VRQGFSLGAKYKYPFEMMKYHYPTVPISYFKTLDEDDYSEEDFDQPTPTNDDQKKNIFESSPRHKENIEIIDP
jgi:hypothetical protein